MGPGDQRRQILTTSSPLLTVDALVAGYGRPIVGPLSFTLGRGEVVALTGANGTGKTTVLNAIIGTARTFGGRVLCDRSAGIAVLRQFPVHLKEMPILGAEFLAITGAATRAVPAAVRPLLNLRVDRLSGGQYQLLMVWACLGSGAGVVVLDEPTNNMDPFAVRALVEMLADARGRGQGVLVVTHELPLLASLAPRPVAVDR